jgi:AcrR family transcriptional regulator
MPRVVDREEKRRIILRAAMTVFARKGIMKTRASDIAREAGVGKGTIYEYFRSKEEIFSASFEFYFENLSSNIQESLARTDDPEEKLRIIIEESLYGFLQDGGKFAGLIMEFWAEGVRKKEDAILGPAQLNAIYAEFRTFIAEVIRDGITRGVFEPVDAGKTASIIIAALDGIGLQWILDHRLFDLKIIAGQIHETLLKGIRKI